MIRINSKDFFVCIEQTYRLNVRLSCGGIGICFLVRSGLPIPVNVFDAPGQHAHHDEKRLRVEADRITVGGITNNA